MAGAVVLVRRVDGSGWAGEYQGKLRRDGLPAHVYVYKEIDKLEATTFAFSWVICKEWSWICLTAFRTMSFSTNGRRYHGIFVTWKHFEALKSNDEVFSRHQRAVSPPILVLIISYACIMFEVPPKLRKLALRQQIVTTAQKRLANYQSSVHFFLSQNQYGKKKEVFIGHQHHKTISA